MPSVSKAQAIAARIAKSDPEKLYDKNKGFLKMKGVALSHFADTPTKGLPYKKRKKRS